MFKKAKKEVLKAAIQQETKYVVYLNMPKENDLGYCAALQGAQEFATLEKAKECARGLSTYYVVYVGEVKPLCKFSNMPLEEVL